MCISYLFVAEIKHNNQKQLMEEQIYFGVLFPRESGRKNGSRQVGQEGKRPYIQACKWGETVNSHTLLQ